MNNNKKSHIEKMKKYLNNINIKLNKIEKNIDESTDYDFIEKLILALDMLNIRINNLEKTLKQDISSSYLDRLIYKDNKIISQIDSMINN